MRRLVIWLLLAVGITWPVMSSPQQQLLGSEAVDVWNHAWGYWYVFEALSSGRLPLSTQLVGAPHGGSLYFIDTLGALWALPITALLGPAVAYNVVMLSRVALAGLCGQLLARGRIQTARQAHRQMVASRFDRAPPARPTVAARAGASFTAAAHMGGCGAGVRAGGQR